ncbi:hypothetical protein [Streptomyces sp. NPDC002851]
MVKAERRWLGVTNSHYDDVVLLHAGHIRADGITPTDPVVETSAQSTDVEALLREMDRLWRRLDDAPAPKTL